MTERIEIIPGAAYLIKDFLPTQADKLFEYLQDPRRTGWEQWTMRFGERIQPIAHLNQFYGDPGTVYRYSQQTLTPKRPWNNGLTFAREQLRQQIDADFNACLLNYYRTGRDSVGWHADDESDLVPPTLIASISLGAERIFELKHTSGTPHHKIPLPHNSCLVMHGTCQQHYRHRVDKVRSAKPRINLTYRQVHVQPPT